jgi:hypothetical protein
MKSNFCIILSLFLPFVTSCNTDQESNDSIITIDIVANMNNLKQVNLSQFTNEIQYIPLESREDASLSGIRELDIKDNNIIITDGNALFLYEMTGHLISKFGTKGRGPEEYQFISNLSLGKDKKIFFNSSQDLFEFNSDGSFGKKYSKILMVDNMFYLGVWRLVDDSLLFGRIDNTTGQMKYKAFLINKCGKVKHSYKNYDLFEQKPTSRVWGGKAQISQFNGSVFYNEQFTDTIFSLDNKYDLIPRYYFNLGNLKMPKTVRTVFMEWAPKLYDYLSIEDFFQTKNYLLLIVNFGKSYTDNRLPTSGNLKVLGLFNKHSGELIFCQSTSNYYNIKKTGLKNDIDGGPVFSPQIMVNDSTMAMHISVKNLKEIIASDEFKNSTPKLPEKKKHLEELVNRLTEFDNPVLMLVTFKN